jgi:hypothetical protein
MSGPAHSLDATVQAQIDLANAEILSINTNNPAQATNLNTMWAKTATQLNIEQRARSIGLSPLASPRDELFSYPTMIYSFTDLLPSYAISTQPNMASQNLEAISDLDINTGQSIVAAMRSARNQARLNEVGIPQDDNIPDTLSPAEATELTVNGTLANSSPAYPFNVTPFGYYDPTTENYIITNLGQPTILGAPNSSVAAVLGIGTPDNLPVPSGDIGIGTAGISQVSTTGPFFDYGSGQGGGPIVPGSLAGSPYTNLIPPALNPIYTSTVLLPASLSVAQAIEQVITCNCDCWVQ